MDVFDVRKGASDVGAEGRVFALIFQQFGATGERIVREGVE